MSKLSWLTARPIAHRGLHDLNRNIWENTASAFSAAIAGHYTIECDLQYTADDRAVVIHDHNLLRLCGIDSDVRDWTSTELTKLSVGGTADKVLCLPELLRLVDGAVPLLVELKGSRGRDAGFSEAVLRALAGYRGRLALMSFDAWLLGELRDLACPWPLGLTAEGQTEEALAAHAETMALGLDFISYCSEHLPNPFVTGLRAAGVPVIAWTIRTAKEARLAYEKADQITFAGFRPSPGSAGKDGD